MGIQIDPAVSQLSDKRIAILGVGNMGGAIAHGLLSANAIAPSNLILFDSDTSKADFLRKSYPSSQIVSSTSEAVSNADILILAVKGFVLAPLLEQIKSHLSPDRLIISIIAGKSIGTIESHIPDNVPVIRAMPNTAAMVLESATGIAKNDAASEEDLALAKAVFESIGKVVVVGESHLDAVTGLSGSGPAYIFMVIEALTDAGVLQGLTRDVSRLLAAQTVFGASKIALENDDHLAKLKDMVTTPGGTTIHGLAELEAHGVRAAFLDAVAAATDRSKQMG
jgi:pyrroline-5-carboxylate reductase